MLQAIVCKYHGPTDTKGSRIKATARGGSLTIHIDNSKDIDENAADAARMLAVKLGWENARIGGVLPDGRYVFVLV